jgi:hypothetical protein
MSKRDQRYLRPQARKLLARFLEPFESIRARLRKKKEGGVEGARLVSF